jgi:hypothetical protein
MSDHISMIDYFLMQQLAVNVGATFPDDFEDSPLKSEILQKPEANPGIEDSYHPVSTFHYVPVK